jgi:hypothetical protein
MSLLTNEQIAELVCIASNQSTSKDLYEEFHEWNEKQIPSIEFEPDWGNVPSNITRVYLDAVWFNSEMKEIERTTICCWDKPTTPHPHAEMIMKYAEVAARRVDPWVEFEWTNEEASYVWRNHTCSPIFRDTHQYRHIGETK